ncbi:DUF4012 domain-containing protein [Demequina zhanjiangensis]|uniref:DUF4012 domain-containing protein n=1 Tax=Demequina zhanjiangensis TaxID=3051659 RepID=A0ABT8FZZ9_9MICO|nr:DUF4012 domain-containing protein [Demequina sp. SYSU T00b26]MDN4472039.1 DUF4012 domain-containing protein [Demequina sp. SYSU T00b26]
MAASGQEGPASDRDATDTHQNAPGREAPARRRTWPKVVLVVIGVLLLGVAAMGVAFALDARTLDRSSQSLTASASAAQDALADRDAAGLNAAVSELTVAAADFAGATDGPHWWVAAHVPWVADQVVPLSAAGSAVDRIAQDALVPLASIGGLEALESPQFVDGRLDPGLLADYREPLALAATTLDEQREVLAAVDLTGTVEPLAEQFTSLQDNLAELSGLVGDAHVVAELLPAMLGGEGARTYLVMIQNNAEPRATGGVPGAFLELTADDGRLTTGDYVPSWMLKDGGPIAGVTEDELRVLSYRLATYPQDVTAVPDFPRAAALATEFWESTRGETVDGVVSIDPIALGWMLEGADPVAVDGVEITADNVAELMLSEAYALYAGSRDQDVFFGKAAAAVFGALSSGSARPMDGVERAIEEHRLLVWSADASDQELLAQTPIAGDYASDLSALGIYVNDGSGNKMGYYLDVEAVVTGACTGPTEGSRTVKLTLTHTFEGDVADLPDYVAQGVGAVPRGELHLSVLVVPPRGTVAASLVVDGEQGFLAPETVDGRRLVEVPVVLAPGGSTTLELDLEGAGAMDDVVVTPGAREPSVTVDVAGC